MKQKDSRRPISYLKSMMKRKKMTKMMMKRTKMKLMKMTKMMSQMTKRKTMAS